MKKIASFALGLLLIASTAFAIGPMLSLTSTQTNATSSQVLPQLNLKTFVISWNATVTPRYVIVFDGTTLPSNGATTACTTSHVTGCFLWCRYAVNSAIAPNNDWADWGVAPLGAKFGLVIAISTGAGCGTLTTDVAAANTIVSQSY